MSDEPEVTEEEFNEASRERGEQLEREAEAVFDRWRERNPDILKGIPWDRLPDKMRDDFRALVLDAEHARMVEAVKKIREAPTSSRDPVEVEIEGAIAWGDHCLWALAGCFKEGTEEEKHATAALERFRERYPPKSDEAYRAHAEKSGAPTAPVEPWAPLVGGKHGSKWTTLDALRWIMGWAQSWHRQSGGYMASDTSSGLDRCIALAHAPRDEEEWLRAKLEEWSDFATLIGFDCPHTPESFKAKLDADVRQAGEYGVKAGRAFERGLWRHIVSECAAREDVIADGDMTEEVLEAYEHEYRKKLDLAAGVMLDELMRQGLMPREEFERLYLNRPVEPNRLVLTEAELEELEVTGEVTVDVGGNKPKPYAASTGTHHYPGTDNPADVYTSDCLHGCGCWMGPVRSGGPEGVDPFGACPNEPKGGKA